VEINLLLFKIYLNPLQYPSIHNFHNEQGLIRHIICLITFGGFMNP
jgi:hypothetical protein